MSGFAFIVNGGAISWSCRKQTVVAQSTAESEYIGLSNAAKEASWLKNLITEIFCPLKKPLTLYSDNQAAIAMAKNDTFHTKVKHIALKYHLIRHAVARNIVSVFWVKSENNYADLFTKPLDAKKTKFLANGLGLLSA
jgi:hypothetical protein